jgi:hypothetical protein
MSGGYPLVRRSARAVTVISRPTRTFPNSQTDLTEAAAAHERGFAGGGAGVTIATVFTIYRLDVDELDLGFLESLKAAFP